MVKIIIFFIVLRKKLIWKSSFITRIFHVKDIIIMWRLMWSNYYFLIIFTIPRDLSAKCLSRSGECVEWYKFASKEKQTSLLKRPNVKSLLMTWVCKSRLIKIQSVKSIDMQNSLRGFGYISHSREHLFPLASRNMK